MNPRIRIAILSILIMFSFLLIVSSSSSQTAPILPSNLKYDVKVGDSNTYVVTKAQFGTIDSFQGGIQLENGTYVQFNISKGMKFVVTITTINKSSIGQEQVFAKQTITVKGLDNLVSGEQPTNGLINPVFDNKSSALNYYNLTMGSFSNVSISGDYVSISSISTSNKLTNSYENKINWKTGWVESYHLSSKFTNGTIINDYMVQRENSNLVNSIVNYAITTTEIGSVLIIVAVPILVVVSYRSWSKSSLKRQNNVTYSNYIKNQLKYSKPKTKAKNKTIKSADHALEMIDEILKETEQK